MSKKRITRPKPKPQPKTGRLIVMGLFVLAVVIIAGLALRQGQRPAGADQLLGQLVSTLPAGNARPGAGL